MGHEPVRNAVTSLSELDLDQLAEQARLAAVGFVDPTPDGTGAADVDATCRCPVGMLIVWLSPT
jgi:hypothetical protein